VDLSEYTKNIKGKQSKDWKTWQVFVINDFVDWARGRGLRSVLEITPEVAESYIEMVTTRTRIQGSSKRYLLFGTLKILSVWYWGACCQTELTIHLRISA